MTAGSLVSGAYNFRDVGGLPAGSGRTRSGVLYRSGNLARLDDAGVATMRELGIRSIVDLRDDDEVANAPSLVDGLAVTTARVPLVLGSIGSFFERDASLADFYRELVDECSAQVIAVVRGILVEQPVLVHCTVGKDRTGVTVALALAAAGVDEESVVADYARSEALLPPSRNEMVVAKIRARHPDAVHLEELATRSPAPVMRGLLADLTDRYGSPAEYLRAHGLRDEELAELRRVLIAVD
ncbi:tyrosine-protein phosphatase [Microbacterium rhizomatis]|uniref:Tyrosine-protein phosphatase n=1 Tax=Microbacterium rhizomatis TaxID=1631477 RepID=A0A5J5J554_9MICO|nr:tyrosine-protein phosphatase [Microbacterium rhizomatis]KAA9111160.1 tyrosine-protein phosphatase [Microbacterium rhizomatis]